MFYDWEDNRRSVVALAMRHKTLWYIHLTDLKSFVAPAASMTFTFARLFFMSFVVIFREMGLWFYKYDILTNYHLFSSVACVLSAKLRLGDKQTTRQKDLSFVLVSLSFRRSLTLTAETSISCFSMGSQAHGKGGGG